MSKTAVAKRVKDKRGNYWMVPLVPGFEDEEDTREPGETIPEELVGTGAQGPYGTIAEYDEAVRGFRSFLRELKRPATVHKEKRKKKRRRGKKKLEPVFTMGPELEEEIAPPERSGESLL